MLFSYLKAGMEKFAISLMFVFSLRNFYRESFAAPQTQTLEKRKLFYDQFKLFESEFPGYIKFRYFSVE